MKIVVCGMSSRSLLLFRGDLLRSLVAAGHNVTAIAADERVGIADELSAFGVSFRRVHARRTSMSPLNGLNFVRSLGRLFDEVKPDVILAYTHQPILFGATAARWRAPSARFFALVTGLGYTLTDPVSLTHRAAGKALTLFYRAVSRHFSGVIFQNPDDRAFFQDAQLLPAGLPRLLVNGSGVNLDTFAVSPLPSEGPVFLMAARLLREKGIREFVQAAAIVRTVLPGAQFVVAGAADSNPGSLRPDEISNFVASAVDYRGAVADIKPLLASCTVAVLPSYREGTPRFLLEAMATGRPVVTTDVPGCRETVRSAGASDAEGIREGDNGFLVPVRSVTQLAAAMIRLGSSCDLAVKKGIAARSYAEERFDARVVAKDMMGFLGT